MNEYLFHCFAWIDFGISMPNVNLIESVFFLISEHNFSIYSASTTAASSIAASLYGMHWHLNAGISISALLDMLKELTGVEKVSVIPHSNCIRISGSPANGRFDSSE